MRDLIWVVLEVTHVMTRSGCRRSLRFAVPIVPRTLVVSGSCTESLPGVYPHLLASEIMGITLGSHWAGVRYISLCYVALKIDRQW